MKPSTIIITRVLLLSIAALFLASCATTGQRLNSDAFSKESYYGSLRFDSRGMPAFSERLSSRPDKKGGDFFLVEEDSVGRPLKYYHISVKGGEADMKRPFRTLLERTAGGIKGGAGFAAEVLNGTFASSEDEAAAVLTFAALSVAVGTVGGITVGLVEGAYAAFVEAGKGLSSTEELLSFSLCDYNGSGRLVTLRAFEPGPQGKQSIEIFRVRYTYEGGSGVPSGITVEDVAL
jgi:hypothetical protein